MAGARLPERIDKYIIVRELPGGGMGTVYLASDPGLQRKLVIKLVRDAVSDDELLERFYQEARATANLRHTNIVSVYGFGLHEGRPYMAMEFVEGASLHEIIRRREPLDLHTKLSYLEQICDALQYAHQEGIIHRDVKPANLMIDSRGVVRVLDFGIARVEGSGLTSDGTMIGTLNYMSPEQMLGQPVDVRSDIFSLGAVAYELISYQQAFPGTPRDGLLHRLPNTPPRPLAQCCQGLPAGLESVVLRALEKNAADRFPNLDAMRAAVADIRRDLDPASQPTLLAPARRGKARSTTPPPHHPSEGRTRQVWLHLESARTALEQRDLDSAIAACEAALTLEPENLEAATLLGECQRSTIRQRRQDRARLRQVMAAAAGVIVVAAVGVWLATRGPAAPGTIISNEPRTAASVTTPSSGTPPAVASGPILPDPALRSAISTAADAGRASGTSAANPAAPARGATTLPGVASRGVTVAVPVQPQPRTVPQPSATAAPATAAGTSVSDRRGNGGEAAQPSVAQPSGTAPAPSSATAASGLNPTPAPAAPPTALAPPTTATPTATPSATPSATASATASAMTAPAARPSTPLATSASAPAASSASPAAAPSAAGLLSIEGPLIAAALRRYQDAYRAMDVDALRRIYPSLPREAGQRLARQFRDCRAYDVVFAGMSPSMGEDPGQATVTARTTYTCTPKTGQNPLSSATSDVFQMRKFGGTWIIESAGSLN